MSKNILKMLSTLGKFERELCNFSFDRLHKAVFFQHPNARVLAFLVAPNETTEAFNNNKASVLMSLSHLADEFIKSFELRFVMAFFLFLSDFVDNRFPAAGWG